VTPAYYDQSGQLVMGNSRALPQMVRLMSPAALLMNSPAGQQSKTSVSGFEDNLLLHAMHFNITVFNITL